MFIDNKKIKYCKSKYSNIKANLKYPLTKVQLNASKQILDYVKNKQSVIVNAVCGAGKTELVYQSIEYFLNQNKKVAFAIPRKEVVKEIYLRLKKDYPNINIKCVYGGHNKDLNGDLIVLTTHQLYHYKHFFDLIILDEADAFPFYKNTLLNIFLKKANKGVLIYLSATIQKEYLKSCSNVVYVNRRFHNYDLPIPQIILIPSFLNLLYLKYKIKCFKNKPLLIFVPTIKIGYYLQKYLKINFIYSSKKDKNLLLKNFIDKKINILITTSILERGITIENVQVIVYQANHKMFDISTLVQICGRVGRKINYPKGEIVYICNKINQNIRKSYQELKKKNQESV